MDGWFDALVNGTSNVLVAKENAKAAAAYAQASAYDRSRASDDRLQQMMDERERNSRYVLWGLGAVVLLFMIRATNRG